MKETTVFTVVWLFEDDRDWGCAYYKGALAEEAAVEAIIKEVESILDAENSLPYLKIELDNFNNTVVLQQTSNSKVRHIDWVISPVSEDELLETKGLKSLLTHKRKDIRAMAKGELFKQNK